MTIEDRLRELGLRLPAPVVAPPGVRLPFDFVRVHGDAARATALSMLASLEQALGDLDRVAGWVKALGFVNCAEGYTATPAAINGFSDLIMALWGDAGRHARSAIGAGELPFGMPVEVEAVSTLG